MATSITPVPFREVLIDTDSGLVTRVWARFLDDLRTSVVEEEDHELRVDSSGDPTIYIGEARLGASETDPVWQLRKANCTDVNNISITWAGGNSLFDNKWSERAIEVYS
jgi:hypothetical protein